MVLKRWTVLLALLLAAPLVLAQTVAIPVDASDSDAGFEHAMPVFAERVIAGYREADRDQYLDNLFRLQLVAGKYQDARASLLALRHLREASSAALVPAVNVQYEIYADAKQRQAAEHLSFDAAFAQAFRAALADVDDRTAAQVVFWVFGTSVFRLEADLQDAREQARGKTELPVADAIVLVRRFLGVTAYRGFAPLVPRLFEEDDRRRYIVEKDVLVRTPEGASVCTLIVRPRTADAPAPALLNFSVYADPISKMDEARLAAAHGYAGVMGLTRGKGCSPDAPIPIEHDGADAAALIDWISRQPWSDGRVGMYGGSYDGFTQWATARRFPPALKALMPLVSFSPGTDFPMEGNVFLTYAYPWPLYTTNVKTLDNATYFDAARWERLERQWYVTGSAYRDLLKIDGTRNPIFQGWLDHPSYDAYWRRLTPSDEEFSHLDIPVLTVTGYYDSGQIGALQYFREHVRNDPRAQHYLVIGPYDHHGTQVGTILPTGRRIEDLRGYGLDPVAPMDPIALRFQWFDYVFQRGPKPALLQDRVNYEVMGANVWKHAPSLDAMHDDFLRLYLRAEQVNGRYRLAPARAAGPECVDQTVDLADRSDVDQAAGSVDLALDTWNIVDTKPNIANALEFVSEPFADATEISGLFSGHLDFVVNKKDFDVSVALYELTQKGEYMHLAYYWRRASYADRAHRHLLAPGKREQLDFESGRLTSRQMRPGSRLVVLLGVLKQPGEQINYGTGKDVSDETIQDAKEPLRIKWCAGSFVKLPVKR
jgi:uncharacterized protein